MTASTNTKPKTGRQIIAATRRSINSRIDAPRTARQGATLHQLRRTLRDSCHPTLIQAALDMKGVTARDANADDLYDILCGIRWAAAYNKPLSEYFATPWGQDTGEQVELI